MVSFTGSVDGPADHRNSGIIRRGRGRGRGHGGVSSSPRRMRRLLLAGIFVVGDRCGGRLRVCHAKHSSASSINQGVPGSTHTDSGYDTEMGVDPICWVTENGQSLLGTGGAVPLEGNKLVSEFYLPLEPIQLLRSCPQGVSLTGAAPPDLASVVSGKMTYRTGTVVPYRIRVSIPDPSDLPPGGGDRFVSDKLPFAGMQVQIVLCLAGEVGFCSPYVHEHANARLERMNATEESVPKGGRHAGTHVHAYGDFVPLGGMDASSSGASREVDVVVPVLVNEPGDFFAIAAVQMFTANATHPKTPAYKYDVANALENRLISYQDPAEILTVSTGVRIATVTIVAIAAALEAALLAYGVTHRHSKVMQLCQGRFLIAFLLAALVATMGSVLFEPRSNLYCTLRGPLVFIPLQLMYAITAGRLWRINAVISPLLKSSMRRVGDTVSSRFCDFLTFVSSTGPLACAAALVASCNLNLGFGRSRGSRRSTYQKENKFRVTVSNWQLAKVVAIFSMPMIVVQVLGAVLDTKTLDVMYNSDESVGEAYCRAGDGGVIGAFDIASVALFFFLFLVLLVMAYESRDLPSLLNETEKIYNGALFTLFVISLGVFIIAITSTSVTTPDAQYVLSVAMVIAITLNMSFSIMLPKYQVINDGDHVMVSKLVSDHRERSMNSQTGPHSASSRISTNELSSRNSSRNSDGTKLDVPSGDFAPTTPREDCNDEEGLAPPRPITSKKALVHRFSSCLGNGRDSRMMITEDKTPPRTLLLRMVDAHESLEELNKRIMSGMTINRQEWEELREILVDVGHTFRERVHFEWDEDSSVERAAVPDESSSTTNHLEGKVVSNCAFTNPAA